MKKSRRDTETQKRIDDRTPLEKVVMVLDYPAPIVYESDQKYIFQIMDKQAKVEGVDISQYTDDEGKITKCFLKAADSVSKFNFEYVTKKRDYQQKGHNTKEDYMQARVDESEARAYIIQKTINADDGPRNYYFDIDRKQSDVSKIAGKLSKGDSMQVAIEKRELVSKYQHRPTAAIQDIINREFPSAKNDDKIDHRGSEFKTDTASTCFIDFKQAVAEIKASKQSDIKPEDTAKKSEKNDPMEKMRSGFDALFK